MHLQLSLLLLLFSHLASSMLLGWVESPGYPRGYLPHASLNWSRCARKGHVISITLIHLDLEDSPNCENDAVKVLSNGRPLSILCGRKGFAELQSSVNPVLQSSPGGCLNLLFVSDFSNKKRHSGFRGFYTEQDFDECQDDSEAGCTQFCHNFVGGYYCSCRHGYHLKEDNHTCTVHCSEDLSGLRKGDISSPSWPAPYAMNADCLYTLSVEDHLQVELHFSEGFDVEQSTDGHCIDALMIQTPSGNLGSFCGLQPPPSPFLTHSSQVHIRFASDGFGTNKGFALRFRTRAKVCPAAVTPHSTATPRQPDYSQGQTVTVRCHQGHIANVQNSLSMTSEYVTTCQRTGNWFPSYACEPVDCGFPSIPEDGILQLVQPKTGKTVYKAQINFKCSSKYYTLEGDDTYTCNADGEWTSAGGNTEMPKCTEVCGKPDVHLMGTGRILGGTDANLGELPWQLLIKPPRKGGASLINDRWAVTAAHVVETKQEDALRIYGGLVNARSISNNEVVMESEKIIIHPNFASGSETNFDSDIALIKFKSRVNLGPNLIPICLPPANMSLVENELGTVSGWGITERQADGTLGTSYSLKYAHIGVYSLAKCNEVPSTPGGKRMVFTDNMFCAGAEGMDSCRQDSGGPFTTPMLGNGKGPFYLSGIVSWGSPCHERKYKGYYTKVKNYMDWIKKTIDDNS
ncbi:complement C1s subcomponent isoform X1 [Takifugu flavidus]|nr:complement C1s subcomponent isoform X1 [Takifugu flavidus]